MSTSEPIINSARIKSLPCSSVGRLAENIFRYQKPCLTPSCSCRPGTLSTRNALHHSSPILGMHSSLGWASATTTSSWLRFHDSMASSSLSPLPSINVADGQRNSRSFTMLHTLRSITTSPLSYAKHPLLHVLRSQVATSRLQLRQGQKANQKTAGIQLSSSSGRSIHNVSARRTRSEGNTSCQSLEKKTTSVATPRLDVITAMVNGKTSISSLYKVVSCGYGNKF